MRSRTTMTYAVALGLASTLALAGCTEGDETPTASPPSTSSPTTSTSPSGSSSATGSATPSPSASVTIPSAARANTHEGAVAFSRFFFDEMSRGYTTLDSASLRQLFSQGCDDCLAVADDIDTQKEAGIRHASPASKIRDSLYTGIENKHTVDIYVTNISVNLVDRAGKTVGKTPAGTDSYRVRSSWTGVRWTVDEIGKI